MKKLRCYIAYHRNNFLPVLSVNIYGGRLAVTGTEAIAQHVCCGRYIQCKDHLCPINSDRYRTFCQIMRGEFEHIPRL